jgi:hypothetical protein
MRLKVMIELIDKDSKLYPEKIKWSIGDQQDPFSILYIPLPINEKYLGIEQVRQTITSIKSYRKIFKILIPIMIVGIVGLVVSAMILMPKN